MKTKIFSIVLFLTLFTLVAQVPSYVPTNGLAAYYPFNGNANDVSSNGNNGINYGATPTTDRNGTANSAMNFNGVNNYISIPYSTSIGVQQEITVSFWVLFNGGGCSPRIIQSSPWGQCGGFTIFTSSTSNTSRYFYTNFENCSFGVLSPTSPSLTGLTWHHVVWSASGLTGISKMYFDGVLVDTDITNGFFTSINYFNRPITIGNVDATSCDWFGGKLDDIGIWNRVLTPQEVSNLNNACATPPSAPVAAASQTFCATPAPTVASLTATGTGVQWYDAATGGTLLANTATLTNGQVAYASQTVSGCESSTRTAVTVTLNDPQITASATTVCSGTAVNLSAISSVTPLTCSLPTNLQNGLVGYWPFCGNANDASGNGNNGTVNGATLTTDRFGNANSAFNFDFINNNLIRVPHNPTLNLSPNYTISVWFNSNQAPPSANNYTFVSKHDNFLSCCGNNVPYLTAITWNANGSYQKPFLGYAINGNYSFIESNTLISINNWQHYVVVSNNNMVTMYLDGVQILNSNFPFSNGSPNTEDLLFGSTNRGPGLECMNGKLDDIAIYNRALSPAEIAQLYTTAPTYLWSTGETTATINPTPTATTTYWCDVTVNGVTCRKEVTITVNSTTSPVATASQTFCATPAPTVANLTATGTGIQWYDAATGGNLVTSTATLTNGQIVYASQTVASCESNTRAAVTVTLNDPQITASATTVCSGTAVSLSAASATANPLTCTLPTNLQNGLVGYWPFCGNANDASGNNNNGTVNGATLTTDRFGNANSAYSFDGVNDYLQCNSVNLNNTITTEFWYKNATDIQTNLSNGHPPIGAEIIGQGTQHQPFVSYSDFAYGISSYGNSINHFALEFSGPVHPQSTDLVSNYLGITNQWNHVVVVRNGNACDYYLNGTLHDSFVLNNNLLNTGAPLSIGARLIHNSFQGGNQITNYFKGDIDNVTIWNRVLNQSEISQLYTPGTTYLWSTGETTATINPTPTATTTYWCDVTVNGVTCRKEVIITVNSTTSPVATASQTFCATPAPTVANLTATGTGIQWYDAATGGNLVASTATLTNGQVLYASQTVASCESTTRTAVTVTLNDPQITASATTVCSGTAVSLSAASATANPLTCNLPTNLQNGLVGYWPFCGNANDASGNGNNGTVNGATLTTDRFGSANSAYSFDGNSNIIFQNLFAFNQNSDASISLWINSNAPNNGSQGTFLKSRLSAPDNNRFNFFVNPINNNQLKLNFDYREANFNIHILNIDNISKSNWTNVVLERNQNNYLLYINGILSNVSNDNNPNLPNSIGWLLGDDPSGNSDYNGKLDDIAIYNRALSPSEIAQLYTTAPTYLWSTGETTATINPTPTATTTYWCDVTVNGVTCRKEIEITVNPTPALPTVTTPVTYCQNATASALTATGTDLLWYTTASGGTGSATAPTPVTTTAGTTTYYVSQTLLGCEGPRAIIDVVVNTTPSPTGAATQTFCATPASTVASLSATGTGIQWYDAATGGNLVASTTTLTNGQVLYASQTVASCESSDRLSVTVALNDPQITASATTICIGNTVNLSASTTVNPLTCSLPTNLQNGLVGYWPFCGNANDVSGNNNNGNINGATLTTDRLGNLDSAYNFDGNDVITTNINRATMGDNMSISCFYKYQTNSVVNYEAIIGGNDSNGTEIFIGKNINTQNIGVQDGNYIDNFVIGSNAFDGNWHQITYTYENNIGKIYLDGLLSSTGNFTKCNDAEIYNFGSEYEGSGYFFHGTIDEIGFWNRVLSDTEITQLYNNNQTTYLWSTGETTATINPTPTATTTYWCDVTVNGVTCRKEITITVDSAPAPTVTTPVTYCQNSVASPLTATGANLLWYTVPTGGTGSATAPTPDTTTAGSTTWYVSQSIAGCESTREVIVINVTPSPAPPLVTTPLVYCQNSAAIPLAATGTNLLWYTAPNAGIGSTTAPTPSTSTAGSTFYYVSQTVFGCESPREIIEVSITPTPPTPSVTSPLTYCQYSNAVPLVATGTNLLWYTASIGGSGSNIAPTPVTTFPGVRNYFVSQTISGCESPRAAIEVTITAVPFPPAVTNQVNYCQNSIATPLTATGTNLLWYTTATGGTGSVTAPTPNTATAGITNYYVSQTVAGCEGSRAIIVVRIIATPLAPPVLTPVTFCQYSTVAPLNALGPNLLWYTDPNLGTGSITAPTPDTATAGITTYYVSQSISGCEGPRAAIEVIISAAPSEPIVTTPVSYCQNSVALPLTATGTNLLWYTAATGGTGVVLAPTPITTITGNTTYYVSQTVSGCESLRTVINVIINAAPLEPTGNSSQYFCANIYPTIQDLILNQNSINWYSSSTSSTALTPSTPLIPNTIYYAEQFDITTGCQSLTRLAVTVFIINENAPTIVDDLTFCEADEKTIEDINTNGAIVIWYDTPTGGTPLSSNYVLVNSQVLYAATYNSTSGCESLDRQSVTITTFDCEVKVNNLLTLDGNNLNDNLNIINIESFPANEIEIYNRYGQVVWRIENYNNTTNTFKGRANVGGVYQINDNLPTGTYYYVLKYYNPHRNKYEVTKSYLYISNTN